MKMSDIATENITGRFYGVYLLCSESLERNYRGKCYIGFTVNPTRRLKQHNAGTDFGGARQTSKRGPWQMVLIVHGFPNNIAALQFEWAWQNPKSSLRLKGYPELQKKDRKENWIAYNLRILNRMLLVGPWARLPLVVRWLEQAYKCDLPLASWLPSYMQIVSGKIEVVKKSKKGSHTVTIRLAAECHLCMERIEQPESSRIGCLNSSCKLTCHLICLANYFLLADKHQQPGYFIPTTGVCPLCGQSWTWAALVEHKRNNSGMFTQDFEDDEEDKNDLLPCSNNENDFDMDMAQRQISKNSIELDDMVYVLSD